LEAHAHIWPAGAAAVLPFQFQEHTLAGGEGFNSAVTGEMVWTFRGVLANVGFTSTLCSLNSDEAAANAPHLVIQH
jgi:hypothetical protein